MIPSKELLSEVFGFKVISVHNVNAENDIHFNGGHTEKYPYFLIEPTTLNIYELAHKCKEWAKNKEYYLFSALQENDVICIVDEINTYGFYVDQVKGFPAETEPEAIFKACEWIMEQTK